MEIKEHTDIYYVKRNLPKRRRDAHKGDFGKVLIIASSKGMAGAACMAARAAIKSGSGLVTAVVPGKLFSIVQTTVPEVICIKWGKAKKTLNNYDAIAIGPGMGMKKRTGRILKKVLKLYNKTLVIDADGLNIIAEKPKIQKLVREYKGNIIITPHIGEARRLIEKEETDQMSKAEIGEILWKRYNAIAVVKGAASAVVPDDQHVYENTTGNPGMATAGAGDVLTGMILSMLGQGLKPVESARCGVFLHGKAGDLATERLGEHGVTASDIIDEIPVAISRALMYGDMEATDGLKNLPKVKNINPIYRLMRRK